MRMKNEYELMRIRTALLVFMHALANVGIVSVDGENQFSINVKKKMQDNFKA